MKLTDFSETELKTEKFRHSSLHNDYYKWNDTFGWQYTAHGLCTTNSRMSPAMLASNNWQIYKPELKLEKGKYYRDGQGVIWECLKTDVHLVGIQPCILFSNATNKTRRTELNGLWSTANRPFINDMIEEVPAPKEPE